jgi:hypothetical protein
MPAKMQTQLNRVAVKHVPMNQVWQPQLCVYHKFFNEVCVAGHMQFKRARTSQSFGGGTMLTSRTRRLTIIQQRH